MPQVKEKIAEKQDTDVKIKQPPKYVVIFMNDDFTSMDFVVEMLKKYFGYDMMKAINIMMEVHTNGNGIVGVYPKDIAETKVECVMNEARKREFPFLCIAAPEK